MRFTRPLLAVLATAFLSACASEAAAPTSNIVITLDVGGVDVDCVTYVVDCSNGDPIAGTLEVVDSDPPIWATIANVAVGECTVTLTAYDGGSGAKCDEGNQICQGSETVTVVENDTTKADITLECDQPLGDIEIDGEFVTCPVIHIVNAIPMTVTEVGGTSHLQTQVTGADDIQWASSGGTLDADGTTATLTCPSAGGMISVAATATASSCDQPVNEATVVVCPGGGTGGTGGGGGTAGTGGTGGSGGGIACDRFKPEGSLGPVADDFLTPHFSGPEHHPETHLGAALRTYVFGDAPVIYAKKRHDQTHPTGTEESYAPVNEMFVAQKLATPEDNFIVTPNMNVVYGTSHLDLSKEPMVLYTPGIPDEGTPEPRYWVWQFMDAYTNDFAYLGSRTTGNDPEVKINAIVGPFTSQSQIDELDSQGFNIVFAPTNQVWMVGRFEVFDNTDQNEIDHVNLLMRQNGLVPLSEYDPNTIATIVNPQSVRPCENLPEFPLACNPGLNIDGINFYTILNRQLTLNNPPNPNDTQILATMARVCVGPNFTTDFQNLPVREREVLREAELILRPAIWISALFQSRSTAEIVKKRFNSWTYSLGAGDWGKNYWLRAEADRQAIAVNLNEECTYPITVYLDDIPMISAFGVGYKLVFPQEMLPIPIIEPGFWSMTLYNIFTYNIVRNPIDRYQVGSNSDLQISRDGSLEIYIQKRSPGKDKESNWLPTGKNFFYLTFRMYHPEKQVYELDPSEKPCMNVPSDQPCYVLPRIRRTLLDTDEDGIVDLEDNCPFEFNPLQEDEVGNGVGDVCHDDARLLPGAFCLGATEEESDALCQTGVCEQGVCWGFKRILGLPGGIIPENFPLLEIGELIVEDLILP